MLPLMATISLTFPTFRPTRYSPHNQSINGQNPPFCLAAITRWYPLRSEILITRRSVANLRWGGGTLRFYPKFYLDLKDQSRPDRCVSYAEKPRIAHPSLSSTRWTSERTQALRVHSPEYVLPFASCGLLGYGAKLPNVCQRTH